MRGYSFAIFAQNRLEGTLTSLEWGGFREYVHGKRGSDAVNTLWING